MADKIKMETNEVAKFRQLIDQISETIKNRMNDLKYLIDNFNQVSSSMNILKEHMYQGVKVGNDIRNMLDKMAFDVERARVAFITADNEESTLFRGDDGIGVFNQVGLVGGTLGSLYRGETAAEKLAKYKSINIVTTKDKISSKFWSLWDSIMNDKIPLS
ncbi:MAG: hypothetical protein PHX70_06510 [Clostridium sp.]|nr:hypothetical protein [Clostridium sp.]